MGVCQRAGEITESLGAGAQDIVEVAFIIGFARTLLVGAADEKVIDTLLYALAGLITLLHPAFAAQVLFFVQDAINFFILALLLLVPPFLFNDR